MNMDSGNQNNWCRPWTTEELRDNADNWSLAGDVALLNTIKAFSEVKLPRKFAIVTILQWNLFSETFKQNWRDKW